MNSLLASFWVQPLAGGALLAVRTGTLARVVVENLAFMTGKFLRAPTFARLLVKDLATWAVRFVATHTLTTLFVENLSIRT